MPVIRQEDFIQSIADAFQFISIYHPLDFIRAMKAAYDREESPAARDAMAQILINSRMCAEGQRPICQDTGMAVVFLRIGMNVRWECDANASDANITDWSTKACAGLTPTPTTRCAPRF
jgi:fumarate hydratase class I